MARIRTIKPEFWVSEQIGNCSRNARLLFIGLWNFCDDRGVHPAKPRTLKAEVFPQDEDITSVDVADWAQDLLKAGLIAEFEVTGERFWYVTGWLKHQRIDKPSNKHPAPPVSNSASIPRIIVESSSSATRQESELSASIPRAFDPGVEGKGKEGKGEEGKGVEESKPSASSSATPTTKSSSLPPCDFDGIVAAYHSKLPNLPSVRVKTKKRQEAMRKRWQWVLMEPRNDGTTRASNSAEAMDWMTRFFERATHNDFIMERVPRSPKHENWRADLDFLLSDSGLVQVLEKTAVAA